MANIFEKIQDILTGNDREQSAPEQPLDPENDILPASMDPYGDPADADPYAGQRRDMSDEEEGILPASMDPMGDPADQENPDDSILPASLDPLGDPADDEYDRNRPL